MPKYIPYIPVDSPEHVAGSLELKKIKNQQDEDLKTLNQSIDSKSTPERRKKAAKKLYFKYNKKRNKFSLNPDKDFEDQYIDPIILMQLHKEQGELKDATNEQLRKTMLNYANNSFLSPYYLQSPVKSNTLEGAQEYFNVAKNATNEPFSTAAFMASPAFSSLLLGSLGYMASDKVAEDAGLTETNRKIAGIAGGATTGLLSYLTHGTFKNMKRTKELIDEMKKGPIDVPYTELNSNLIKNTQKYLPANSKTYFQVTGDRPLLPAPKLTSHVQGDEAVKMFKEYGGTKIPKGSINGEQLRMYVPEARERYGLVGNTDITDEEIAEALYKHTNELGEGTAAINEQREPQLLFRGDTKRYTELKPRMTPEQLAKAKGTMDNSLGTLFLGEFPYHYQGADRYLGTVLNFRNNGWEFKDSGTGSKVIGGERMQLPPKGSYLLYSTTFGKGNYPITVMKLPSSYMESGVNDLNAFVVRTPAVRDATPEISVLNDDWLVKGAQGSTPHMNTKLIYDKDGFPLFLQPDGSTSPALGGYDNRQGMAEHYRFVLNDAQKNKQGLIKSNKKAPLRDEHSDYTYFALPNFNIRGAKHILPYDLRIPRDWNDPNIFRFTDRFGKEITPTPYYGSKEELQNSLVNGIIKGIKYRTSPQHMQQIQETMGWTDDQMARLSEEFKKLSSNMSIGVGSLEEGMSDIGAYHGKYIKDSNGNVVGFKSDIYGNIDRIPNDAIAMETGAHEMGGHGLTAGIRAEQSNPQDKYFPLIKELMQKNKELARQILVPINDNSWDDAYNYFTDDNELVTRVIADNALGGNTSGFEKLKEYFTPESLQKYKKVVLSLLGVTSVGTAASNNRYGGKLIKRKFK